MTEMGSAGEVPAGAPAAPGVEETRHGRLARSFVIIIVAEIASIAGLYWLGAHFG